MHARVHVRLSGVALFREPECERDWIMIRGVDGRVDVRLCRLDGPDTSAQSIERGLLNKLRAGLV